MKRIIAIFAMQSGSTPDHPVAIGFLESAGCSPGGRPCLLLTDLINDPMIDKEISTY